MRDNNPIWFDGYKQDTCDVAIVGAGIVGLATAIFLKTMRPALQVCIFERDDFPNGASMRNAGFACFGSPTELWSDIERMGRERTVELVRKRYLGLHALFSLVEKREMDYEQTGSYELFLSEEEEKYQKIKSQIPFLNELVLEATGQREVFSLCDERIEEMELSGVAHLIYNAWEGCIHSGKMVAGLVHKARKLGVCIYWGYEMLHIDSQGGMAVLEFKERVPFHTRKILLAVNGLASRYFPGLDVYPVRNQVFVTSPVKGLKLKGAFHMEAGFVYLRNIGDRVLVGGARHLDMDGSTTADYGEIPVISTYLREILDTRILKEKPYAIEYHWNGFLGVGETKEAIIEMVTDQTGVAVRLGGMGVALGSLVGKEAAVMLLQEIENTDEQ